MAISIRCQCEGEAKLTSKKCPRCGKPFPQKGRKYKVTVRAGGRKFTRTVNNLSVARDVESKLKVDIARGEHQLRKKSSPTIADLWNKYEHWAVENKPKSFKTDKGYYRKHLKPRFENKRLEHISPIDVERLMSEMRKEKSKRGKPYSPTTIKHVVVLLSRLYSIAESWRIYSGTNPCNSVKKPTINNQVTEHLSDEQLARLLETLNEWPDKMSAAFIRFLLLTGRRRGELFKLTWDDIDFENNTVTLRDPKGKIETTLPLSDKAVAVLNHLPKDIDSPYVFYGKDGKQRVDFSGPWKRIRKAANLPANFRLHGLRHHFASTLVSAGIDIYRVSKLLTHKDIKTTQRYAHLADQALRDAVAVSDHLYEANLKTVDFAKVRNHG